MQKKSINALLVVLSVLFGATIDVRSGIPARQRKTFRTPMHNRIAFQTRTSRCCGRTYAHSGSRSSRKT
jgi:hypothetical protein